MLQNMSQQFTTYVNWDFVITCTIGICAVLSFIKYSLVLIEHSSRNKAKALLSSSFWAGVGFLSASVWVRLVFVESNSGKVLLVKALLITVGLMLIALGGSYNLLNRYNSKKAGH